MRCTHPLYAWRKADAGVGIYKQDDPRKLQGFPLPCGRCIECKLERTRQWAVRITHEQQLHEQSYFVTLTYKTDPRTLIKQDFQRFMKRLRAKHGCWDPTIGQHVPRYFMCGEYGEKKDRPHYHMAVFGITIPDLVIYSETKGNKLYTSKTIDEIWTHGECKIGALTFESASYVAAYCTKKITGKDAGEHYTRCDPETGEIYGLEPEYAHMSLKPGIGALWIEKYTNDVFNYDHVVINGREQKTPRYYDKYLEQTNPERLEAIKKKRKLKAINTEGENTPARLKVREQVTKARYKLKKRTI